MYNFDQSEIDVSEEDENSDEESDKDDIQDHKFETQSEGEEEKETPDENGTTKEEQIVTTKQPEVKTKTHGKQEDTLIERDERFEVIELERFKEHLKVLIGEYLSKCKASQYEIIETFMRIQVFDQGTIDQTFLQDVLNHRKSSKSKYAAIMKRKGILLSMKKQQEITKSETTKGETTKKETTKGQEQTGGDDEFIRIKEEGCKFYLEDEPPIECIFCISNYGVYVLKPVKGKE